jgi:hypothetical protein
MPFATPAPTSAWQSVTLTADENWQARGGDIYVTAEATPPAGGGIQLMPGLVYSFTSGTTVYYRNSSLPSGEIWREAAV